MTPKEKAIELFVLNEIDSTEQWNASWFYNQVKKEIENL